MENGSNYKFGTQLVRSGSEQSQLVSFSFSFFLFPPFFFQLMREVDPWVMSDASIIHLENFPGWNQLIWKAYVSCSFDKWHLKKKKIVWMVDCSSLIKRADKLRLTIILCWLQRKLHLAFSFSFCLFVKSSSSQLKGLLIWKKGGENSLYLLTFHHFCNLPQSSKTLKLVKETVYRWKKVALKYYLLKWVWWYD